MKNSTARDMADVLANVSGVGSFGTNIFVSREPAKPDNCITLYDTGGFQTDVNTDYQRPTIQVRCRNTAYSTGWDIMEHVKLILNGLNGVTTTGFRYIGVWLMSDIAHIGYDESNRALFTMNFRIHRTAV